MERTKQKITTFYINEGNKISVAMLKTVCSKWAQESSGPDGLERNNVEPERYSVR